MRRKGVAAVEKAQPDSNKKRPAMTWGCHIREALTELFLRMSLPDCLGNHELQALSQTVLLRTGKFNSMRHSFHYFHTLTTVSSVQFSVSVVSTSLRPHGPQHARTPCSSPTPGVYLNSCALSRWCHLTISSSVVPFSSCLQSFPASGAFQMSQYVLWITFEFGPLSSQCG